MSTTSFNAFWAGPDKFSFSSLYHHPTHCYSSNHSRHADLYNQYGDDEGQAIQDSHLDFDVSSPSDSAGSSPSAAISSDSVDSDTSDIIWGDSAESESSAPEQSEGDYESQVEYEYDKSPYLFQKDDDFPSLARYTPMVNVMPSFIPQSVATIPYSEPHVQPHYFYIPQAAQFSSMQHQSGVGVANDPNDLSHSLNASSHPPSETAVVASPAIALVQTPSPFMRVAPAQPATATPRKARANKKHARRLEDDDDYRAEEDEALDASQKPCKVHNCLVCTRELPDSLRVAQPSWAAILRIVFYTLKVNYPQKEFFNLRSHVYDFVDAHWERICIGKVKSEHWKKQLQDTLAHNKKLFASGAEVFKQKGFWRLDDLSDPWEDTKGGHSYSSSHSFPKYDTSVMGVPSNIGAGAIRSTSTPDAVSSFIGSGADGGDDEYNPVPRRQRKPRVYKRAKLET